MSGVGIVDLLGFAAALLMLSTFYMQKMIPLRIFGILSNGAFITYGVMAEVWPIFWLHCLLLPLNALRLMQMLRLIRDIEEATKGSLSIDFLVPYMSKEQHRAGTVVFRQGDHADRMFLLQRGTVKLVELGLVLSPGEIIGEMGIFSSDERRMATLICQTDVEFLVMTSNRIQQLYYQNPAFGYQLIQLVINRMKGNMFDLMETNLRTFRGGVPIEQFLEPFMEPEQFKPGERVFNKGDFADTLYLVKRGTVRIPELGVDLEPGELIGEMGIFSEEKYRMASLECVTDVELLSMSGEQVCRVYSTNPEFGLYMLQLIIKRLKSNL